MKKVFKKFKKLLKITLVVYCIVDDTEYTCCGLV